MTSLASLIDDLRKILVIFQNQKHHKRANHSEKIVLNSIKKQITKFAKNIIRKKLH